MNDELRSEVLRRWYGDQSGREIARELHLSRKTVAKVLAEHRQQRAEGTTGLPKPASSARNGGWSRCALTRSSSGTVKPVTRRE